jgi:hypothetical protein
VKWRKFFSTSPHNLKWKNVRKDGNGYEKKTKKIQNPE